MGDVLDQRKAELTQQRHGRAAREVLLHVRLGGGAIGEGGSVWMRPPMRGAASSSSASMPAFFSSWASVRPAEAGPDDQDGRIALGRCRRGLRGEIDLRTLALTPPRTSLDGERCRHQ